MIHNLDQDETTEALGHNVHIQVSRILTLLQRAVEYLVAIGLLILSCLAVWGTLNEIIVGLHNQINMTSIISKSLDTLLLTLILLELLHTVLSHASLMKRLGEFMIIGIFSAVRYGLEVVASTDRGVSGVFVNDPRMIAGSLALNAIGIGILVLTLSLVRKMNLENQN